MNWFQVQSSRFRNFHFDSVDFQFNSIHRFFIYTLNLKNGVTEQENYQIRLCMKDGWCAFGIFSSLFYILFFYKKRSIFVMQFGLRMCKL